MQRIIVIGSTGSGKSTLAHGLAEKLGLKYIDLDDFHHLPGWKERPDAEFRALVDESTRGDKWAIAGNYTSRSWEITWPRADTVIWLDMPFFNNLWKLLKRTIHRVLTKETICNGNRERFFVQFLSKNGLIWWFFRSYSKNKRNFGRFFSRPEQHPHIKFIHLKSYEESATLLKTLR